jgi:PucR family transcriptional regulator, purine catabolism regulatory protein
MPLTVRELTEVPFLRIQVLAGKDGLDKTVSWAHACELDRPWEWLETGDLLMTVGLGVPVDPAEQAAFVEALAAAGITGVDISEGMHAPAVSPQMIEAANRNGLPLLSTPFEVPFVQISRTVAAASQGPEHLRLVKTVRIYDSVRAAFVRSSSPAELLRTLGDEIHCNLWVCTNDRGTAVFEGSKDLRSDIRESFLHEMHTRGGTMPGILRLACTGGQALVVPVPAPRATSLFAVPRGSEVPPYAILQHIATIAALELERLLAAREERRRIGAEALNQMIDGLLEPFAAASSLKAHGLGDCPLVMLIAQRDGVLDDKGWLHHALAERGIAHMLLRREHQLHCLISACKDTGTVDEVIDLLTTDEIRLGISETFAGYAQIPEAVREARWALETAKAEDSRCCRYGEAYRSSGPRSIGEARALVERTLGTVLDYDDEHGTDLAHSLGVFLRCNRSWQQASAELFVHKQTLVYRMRRVEELVGLKLTETATIAELWPAIRALDVVGIDRAAAAAAA